MGSCSSNSAVDGTSASSGASPSPSSVASPSVPSPLTRLPSVLVHLVMQSLDIGSLARLACTCRLMRADAMDPSAGRCLVPCSHNFVSLCSPLSAAEYAAAASWQRYERRWEQQTHSPLGRAHLRVTLCADLKLAGFAPQLAGKSHAQRVEALAHKAAGWAHVDTLDLAGTERWSVNDALTFLQSPALQRVRSATNACGVWMCESVQSALVRLPQLSTLAVEKSADAHPSLRVHPSAFAEAAALRSLIVNSVAAPQLAGLVCVPALQCLTLSVRREYDSAGLLSEWLVWLRAHCSSTLSGLRVLQLTSFHVGPLPSKTLRGALRAMPQLRYLYIVNCHLSDSLRGLIDAGSDALAELRVVQLWSAGSRGENALSRPLLLRFLVRFPLVRACVTIDGTGAHADAQSVTMAELAGWPRDRVCTAASHAHPRPDGSVDACVAAPSSGPAPSASSSLPVLTAAADESEDDPASDWKEFSDAATGTKFFFNARTKQTSWEKPDAPEPEQRPLSNEESLRIIEAEYAAAVQRHGPWVQPTARA